MMVDELPLWADGPPVPSGYELRRGQDEVGTDVIAIIDRENNWRHIMLDVSLIRSAQHKNTWLMTALTMLASARLAAH